MTRRHWHLLEALLVLALGASAVLQVHTGPESDWQGGRPVHDVLALGSTLPLLLRRRHPVPVLAVVLVAAWVQLELGGGLGQPFFAVLVALYSTGAHARVPGTWLAPAVVAGQVALVDVPRLLEGVRWDEVVPAWFVLLGAWALGRWVRHRRRESEQLADRAQAAEARVAAAVTEERSRIARELHDLVSHNIGVVVLQAQGAQRALAEDPERAREALVSIEAAGRTGLSEMRRLLGLLTDPGVEPPHEPQPSLARLEDLVEQVRSTGTSVGLDVVGPVRPLGAGIELASYRIVQEALTNALKHAPGAEVRVRVEYGAEAVSLSVVDDGDAPPAPSGPAGHGLVGMRERVALYGGELTAGRRGGGFAVTARLPLGGGR